MAQGIRGERLFLALWPPRELSRSLAAEVARALAGASGLRPLSAERLHLTLAFLGEQPPQRRSRIEDELGRSLERARAPRLVVTGPGAFPSAARPSVLWLGVAASPPGGLRALADAARRAVSRAGVELDDRPFRAHVSVARVRRPRGARLPAAFRRLAWSGAWTPRRIVLARSSPGTRGPAYDSVASWPLLPWEVGGG